MAGSIIKRGNSKTWTIRFENVRSSDGYRTQKSKGGFKTKAEAQKALNEILFKIQQGDFFVSETTLYKDYLTNNWIPNSCKNNVRGKTLENYNFIINSYIIPHLGNISINKLDIKDLEFFYTKLQDELKLSSTTALNCHRVINVSLKKAVSWKIINKNVADFVKKPKIAEVEMQVLESDQVKKLLKELQNSSLYLIALLGFNTGMRRGELVGLKWKNVDLENGIIHVREQMQKVDNKLIYCKPKSDNGVRHITISDNVTAALIRLQETQTLYKLTLGDDYQDIDLVYCQGNGKAYDLDYITRHFARRMVVLSKKLNIPKIRFHDMRHTHATLLLKNGEHLSVVSQRLGHAKVYTTLTFYSHVLPSMQTNTAIILNNLGLD